MRNPPLVLARNPELVQTNTRDTSTSPSRTQRLGSVPAQPAKSVFHTTCFQPRQRVFPFRVQDAWTKGSSGDRDLTDMLVTPYHRHESTLHAARPMLLFKFRQSPIRTVFHNTEMPFPTGPKTMILGAPWLMLVSGTTCGGPGKHLGLSRTG